MTLPSDPQPAGDPAPDPAHAAVPDPADPDPAHTAAHTPDPVHTTDHAEHDQLRVAEAADRAGSLPADLAACPDCVALHSDLVAIAAAIPDAAIPARPRDYRLGPADAARLRRTGWRRWFAAVGSSRDTVTRPLAIGLTTLGLAGLLLTALPSLPFAGTASAPARDAVGGGEMVVQGAPGGGGATSVGSAGVAPSTANGPAESASAETATVEKAPDPSVAPSILPDGPYVHEVGSGSSESDSSVPGGRDTATGAADPTEPAQAPTSASGGSASATATVQTDVPGQPSGPMTVTVLMLIAGTGLFVLRSVARRTIGR